MKLTVLLALLTLALAAPAPAAPPIAAAPLDCPDQVQGDMNGDGVVDGDDLVLFEKAWIAGNPKADWNFDCAYTIADWYRFYELLDGPDTGILDFNNDGYVNIADAQDFNLQWMAEFSGSVSTSYTNVSKLYGGEGDCVVNVFDAWLWFQWFQNC